MKKRILSLALALALVLTLLPIHALALGGTVYVKLKSGLPGVADIELASGKNLAHSEEDFVNGTFLFYYLNNIVYTKYKVSDVPESFGRTDLLWWRVTFVDGYGQVQSTTTARPGEVIRDNGEGGYFTLEAIWDGLEQNSYKFSLPESVAVTENTIVTEIPFSLSELTLGSANLLSVKLYSGEFSDGVNTIRYEDGAAENFSEAGQTGNCSIRISEDEWAKAKAGVYTATLEYDVSFEMNMLSRPIRTMHGSVPMTLQVGHKITVSSNDPSMGTASASATMAREGEPVTLTAAPASNYGLRSWSVQSGGVTVNADNTFIMGNEDVSITAMFDTVYQVIFYNYGDRILYTTRVFYEERPVYSFATPTKPSTDRYDYIFTGWNPPLGPITGDTSYTAQYREEYKCFVDFDANGGTGTMARNSYYKSEGTYTLPSCGFTAPDGQAFKRWIVETDNGDGSVTVAYFMPGAKLSGLSRDITVKAEWQPLIVRVSPEGAGTAVYENGTFTATANKGYTFKEWDYYPDDSGVSSDDYNPFLSTDNPYTPETVKEGVYYAMFTAKTYNLKVQANNEAWGTVSFTGTPQTGRTITLTATANEGYVFKEWLTEPEGIAITNNKFKMPAADVTVTAVFAVAPGWTEYVDADGSTKSAKAVLLTGAETKLPGGWYVVQGEITCDHAITFTGNAHLILADGASLSITVSAFTALYAEDKASLTIYGQSGQSGKLIVESADGSAIEIQGDLTINGGDIEATAVGWNYAAIASTEHSVTINGGKVTAHGGDGRGIDSLGDVAIYGGVVNADGNIGISSSSGNIILGWTDPGDSITASSWDVNNGKTITVRDGQTLMDAESGALYSGDVTSKIEELAGRTLVPYLGPDFKVQSLVLSGQLGVNFFMDLSMLTQDELDASYMEFTLCGKTTKANVNNTFRDAGDKGYYGFTCYVSSIQMADTITAVFHYGEGKTVRKTYSVKEYLATLESTPDLDEEVTNLAHAIADYGYYAQPYLAEVNNWTVGTDHAKMDMHYTEAEDLEATYNDIKSAVDEKAFQRSFNADHIREITYSLNFSAETKINVYIAPQDGYEIDASITVGDQTYRAVKQSDGEYKLTIPNLSAHRLGEMFTINGKVMSGGEEKSTFQVQVSALSYVRSILNKNETDEETVLWKRTVAAFYLYYDAAIHY